MKLIVHPGTGTIIDANDGTVIADVPDSPAWEDEDELISYAVQHGSPVVGEAYAVAVGEAFDGFEFYGSFPSFDDASEWADREVGSSESWWVVRLKSPTV